ncbi:hypothetical protein [Haloarcula marina]|uniref:hypothetical protein n=1 Tax=Haloarcula marina TaxID=2961574 RepID=UPI0020B8D6A9|nr:hypothetical protein [Halomicroarcula marina]
MEPRTDDITDDAPDERPTVTAHESVADRTVFTENGNREGWISTDLTVDLRP